MKGRLTPRGCGDVRRGPPGRTGQAPAGGWKLSPWGRVLLTASGARVYRSVLSTHWPTVGCSPPSVPSEEDVAEPDGRVAPSITSPGTERKCPRCLATSGQQAWGTLAISSRDVPGADFARGRGCLRMGGGRWTFSPCQQDDGPSTGLLVALQCSTLGSSPPGPQNMAGYGDGCLQRGRSYNEVTRVAPIPQDGVLIRHTEGPREDTGRGRRPHA